MNLEGEFKEVKLNGKYRLIYYLDEKQDPDKLQTTYKLTWKKAGMSTRKKLLAVAAGAIGLIAAYKIGHEMGADKIPNEGLMVGEYIQKYLKYNILHQSYLTKLMYKLVGYLKNVNLDTIPPIESRSSLTRIFVLWKIMQVTDTALFD